jgi:hypothetical protein
MRASAALLFTITMCGCAIFLYVEVYFVLYERYLASHHDKVRVATILTDPTDTDYELL